MLGAGGFGVTYLASDKNMGNRKVAIKEYLPTQLATRDSTNHIVPLSDESKSTFEWGLDRFIKEAELLSSIRHPSVVDVFTAFRENGTAYMVMRLEEGQTLASFAKSDNVLGQDFLMGILPPLLDGLEEIHSKGIIHRDIKPDNIIIRSDGSPALIDFGSARKADSDNTQHLTAVYTPGYSPPEQRNLSDGKQGPWTDIYGLGATLYSSISGKPPRDSTARNDSIRESRSDSLIPIQAYAETGFSERFLGAINWSLQYWPEDRPQSIDEWRSSLTPRTQAGYRQSLETTPEQRSPEMDIETEVSESESAPEPPGKPDASARDTDAPPVAPKPQSVSSKKHVPPIGEVERAQGIPGTTSRARLSVYILALIMLFAAGIWIFSPDPDTGASEARKLATELARSRLKTVQSYLDRLGYEVVENGRSDQLTRKAILDFQRQHKLAQTGAPNDVLLDQLKAALVTNRQRGAEQESGREDSPVTAPLQAKKESPLPPTGKLTLNLNPPDASVVLPDIGPRYSSGMSLELGSYRVKASAQGYEPWEGRVNIRRGSNVAAIELKAIPIALPKPKSESSMQSVMVFRDKLRGGGEGPEMVVLPTGSFQMGDVNGVGDDSERPVHEVTIKRTIAMMKYEVTFAEYDRYVQATGSREPKDHGWGRDTRPVMNVTWEDAQVYAKWLSSQTGKKYRLPTEAEWEFAARAGTETEYHWGNTGNHELANYGKDDCCGGLAIGSDHWVNTSPVGSFNPNAFGLYDMHGNVAEWTEDCWHDNYTGTPGDGLAWIREEDYCSERVLRGGSWLDNPARLRSSARNEGVSRYFVDGFRLVQDLDD